MDSADDYVQTSPEILKRVYAHALKIFRIFEFFPFSPAPVIFESFSKNFTAVLTAKSFYFAETTKSGTNFQWTERTSPFPLPDRERVRVKVDWRWRKKMKGKDTLTAILVQK
jgi:hypothetical protein